MARAAHHLSVAGLVTAMLLPCSLEAAPVVQSDDAGPSYDRAGVADLWGRVTLVDGEVLEGFLRWDRNETTTADLLDGSRMPSDEGLRLRRAFSDRTAEDRRRSVELPGLRVTWEEDDDFETLVQSGVRFGHIDRVVRDGPDVVVHLRGGDSVVFRSSSTDVGPSFRGLEVEIAAGNVREVAWPRLSEVRFMSAPDGRAPGRTRLFGTVETDRGLRFSGWIAWDADEVWASDVLDADEGDVAFSEITRLEREGRGTRVTLVSGEQRVLTGSNDVDDGNRGIHVSDPALGRVMVSWDAFASLWLERPHGDLRVAGGVRPLFGTVRTESGRLLEGRIVWDLDETEDWQLLDGDMDGVEVDVEFSRIARIDKARDGDGVSVTLVDGRTLDLEGSNDVDGTNRGIVVIGADGEDRLVDWAGFVSLTLTGPRGEGGAG